MASVRRRDSRGRFLPRGADRGECNSRGRVSAVDRCLKLFALARSGCEAEAAVARRELFAAMRVAGLDFADLAARERARVLVEPRDTPTRRALVLAAAVSRGCEMFTPSSGIWVAGPLGAVASVREVYGVLAAAASAVEVPRALREALEGRARPRASTESLIDDFTRVVFDDGIYWGNHPVGGLAAGASSPPRRETVHHESDTASTAVLQETLAKLREVCRAYFEIGLFQIVSDRLHEQAAAAAKFISAVADPAPKSEGGAVVTNDDDGGDADPVDALDAEAARIVAPVARMGDSRASAATLRRFMIEAGRLSGINVTISAWSFRGPSPPPAVRGLLPAADPEEVERRRRQEQIEDMRAANARAYAFLDV